MPKKLIAIPAGNLMRIAEAKDVKTLLGLYEKTGVDRKTLRAINEGKPVKETTLQKIADKLRAPLPHFVCSQAADKSKSVSVGEQSEYSEIRLEQLDAAGLRKVFEDAVRGINWFLQIDQMPTKLEILVSKLNRALRDYNLNRVGGPRHKGTLQDQINRLKASTEIDECIVELTAHNLKVCGRTFVFWEMDPEVYEDVFYLNYRSSIRVALSIGPKQKANPTVTVQIGKQPPQHFDESELDGIAFVEVDGAVVWARPRLITSN